MDEGDRRGIDRLTIQEAARRLGISEGAVRKRVTRKSLQHDKDDDGRVYVYLDAGGSRGVDGGQDEGVDPDNNALISRLESEVEFLRDQVQRQQEIIAQQAVTMRQLTAAPQEPPEDAETVEEEPEEGRATASREPREELDAERSRRKTAESTLHEGMAEERRRREDAERERDDLRRELNARSRQRGAHETTEGQQGRGSVPSEPQTGTQRPWWRRIFGG